MFDILDYFKIFVLLADWQKSLECPKSIVVFVYLDELHLGPKIGAMVIFLSSSPQLAKLEYTSHVFNLFSLCIGHMVPETIIGFTCWVLDLSIFV